MPYVLINRTSGRIQLDSNITLDPGESQTVEVITNAIAEAFGDGTISVDPPPENPAPVPVDSILDIHVNAAAAIALSKLASGSLILLSNGLVPLIATFDCGAQRLINAADPLLPQDLATKAYADSVIGNVYTAGDGLNLSLNQFSVALANGTLTVGGTGLKLTDLPTGMILIGNGSNVATAQSVSGDASLNSTGVLTLANTGVIAATYMTVTVDSKGRVLTGTTTQSWATLTGTPTTLAGYGITDGVKNGGNVESLGVDIFANRPVAGVVNRLFVSSDTFQFFRDNGVSWDPIGGSGTGTVTSVAVVGGTGLTTSGGPITVSGTITVNLADDVAAIEAITTTGFAVRTATNVWTTRSIQGSAGNISVTDPDGVGGNPVIDLSNVGTPGAYVSVTTDAKGRVTAGSATQSWITITSTPTTLAGYGITDAYTEGEIDAIALAFAGHLTGGGTIGSGTLTATLNADLDDLNDVVITAPATNDVLKWDGANWINAPEVGGGSVTSVATTQPAAGFTITGGPITTSGTLVFTLADDLAAVEALATFGLASRTAANTWVTRTLMVVPGTVLVTDGDGVAGDPTLSLPPVGAPGTYVSVSTDPYGRVMAGSATQAWGTITGTPTTLAGYGITDAQPLDATLTALAAFSTNGLVTQTAADTFTARTITGTAGNITVSDGDGVAGNPTLNLADAGTAGTYVSVTTDAKGRVTSGSATQTWATITGTPTTLAGYGITDAQPLDATLTALAAFNSNGVVVQTAADTFTSRTITGTTNQISVADGDGVAGNPTLSLPSTLVAPGTVQATGNIIAAADITTTTGTSLDLIPGAAATATSVGNDVNITGGPGGGTSGVGGGVVINGGTPTDGGGGSIDIFASNGVGTNRSGGDVLIEAGDGTGTGLGGSVTITAGDSASGTDGSVVLADAGTVGLVTVETGAVSIGRHTNMHALNEGHAYLPFTSTTGTPTGTPTGVTNFAPLLLQDDSGTYKLWAYISGGWRQVTLT